MSKPRVAVYPGTFDPVTNGHLDLVDRACHLFDKVIVAVADNSTKNTTLFSKKERLKYLRQALSQKIKQKKVQVDAFEGLLVNYVEKRKACAVIRGLRAVTDFEYEFQMALMNRHQDDDFETVFLMPDEKYTYLSSSMLKEVARLGGNIRRFVPPSLVSPILKRFKK